jgi:hypothetical protein
MAQEVTALHGGPLGSFWKDCLMKARWPQCHMGRVWPGTVVIQRAVDQVTRSVSSSKQTLVTT